MEFGKNTEQQVLDTVPPSPRQLTAVPDLAYLIRMLTTAALVLACGVFVYIYFGMWHDTALDIASQTTQGFVLDTRRLCIDNDRDCERYQWLAIPVRGR